jgi:hypothetical protein
MGLTGLAVTAVVGALLLFQGAGDRRAGRAHSVSGQPGLLSGPTPRPTFFADSVATAEADTSLQIRASTNGRLIETDLRVPRGASGAQVLAVAVIGSHSFVVALRQGSVLPNTSSCKSQLYRVQLNARGRFHALRPVGPALPGYVGSLAASAGGRIIGYSLIDGMCTRGGPTYIGILQPATDRIRQWHERALLATTAKYVDPTGGVSITADGRELMFAASVSWSDRAIGAYEVAVVRTNALRRTTESRVVLRRAGSRLGFIQAIISPSGRSFYLTSSAPVGRSSDRAWIREYRTGFTKPYATLVRFTDTSPYGVTLDPSGQWLLVPYKLDQGTQQNHWHGGLHLLTINTANDKRSTFFVPLPGFGSMSPPGSMLTAW